MLKRTGCFSASSKIACLKWIPFFYLKKYILRIEKTPTKKSTQKSKSVFWCHWNKSFLSAKVFCSNVFVWSYQHFRGYSIPGLKNSVSAGISHESESLVHFADLKKNSSSFFLFFCPLLIKSCTLCSLIRAYYLHDKLTGIIYSFIFRHCTVDRRGWRMGSH